MSTDPDRDGPTDPTDPADRTGPTGSRFGRWRGLVGLAVRRVLGRALRGPNRVTVALSIVALSVALLIVVTGVGVGLAQKTTVYGSSVDYWIVPEAGTTLSTVVTVSGPQLGSVHRATGDIEAIDGVEDATPVLIDLVRMRAPGSDSPEYVLAVGVVPPRVGSTVSGISTAALTPGDPHYAGGSYDGPFTGEVVLSPAAASLLNASAGDDLAVSSPASGETRYSSFAVSAVSESGVRTGSGSVPVAVVHLSELQTLTGAAEGDLADQFLVRTTDPGVKSRLQGVYPHATVVARASLSPRQVLDADLPLAVTLTALVAGLAIAGLFTTTTMGLEVEADRQMLAVLAALGVTARGRLLLVAATTVSVTAVGGVAGAGLGVLGLVGLNWLLATQFGMPPVARVHPLLPAYGLGIAVLSGLLAVPYPALVARQTDALEELTR